jgi:hypothetical protein
VPVGRLDYLTPAISESITVRGMQTRMLENNFLSILMKDDVLEQVLSFIDYDGMKIFPKLAMVGTK